ncbi:hypothetical protein J6590_030872 [Homalodisca vitripennis]|nr:hypothetical protein J6590_030872 [Homalodisca vitripennis]
MYWQGNLFVHLQVDPKLDKIPVFPLICSVVLLSSIEIRMIEDDLRMAAIWTPDTRRKLLVERHSTGRGSVWLRRVDFTLVNCYFTPNESILDFQTKIDS